ncbi:MAG TPA: hypothetical protein VHS06_09155 [Chloroflexota bacterium]|nr:hypothetical protein [Chloroflexota bacterium]
MKTEAAIIFVIEIAGFVFFLGLLPLAVVVGRLTRVWRRDRGVGLLLLGVLINTAFLFFTLFAAFAGLVLYGG